MWTQREAKSQNHRLKNYIHLSHHNIWDKSTVSQTRNIYLVIFSKLYKASQPIKQVPTFSLSHELPTLRLGTHFFNSILIFCVLIWSFIFWDFNVACKQIWSHFWISWTNFLLKEKRREVENSFFNWELCGLIISELAEKM